MTKIANPEAASARTGDLTLNLIGLSREDGEMRRAVVYAATALLSEDALERGEINADGAIERLRSALIFNIEMNQTTSGLFKAGRA
jgi:hypothetical protein